MHFLVDLQLNPFFHLNQLNNNLKTEVILFPLILAAVVVVRVAEKVVVHAAPEKIEISYKTKAVKPVPHSLLRPTEQNVH